MKCVFRFSRLINAKLIDIFFVCFARLFLTSERSSQVLVAASSLDWQELIILVAFGRVGSSRRARATIPPGYRIRMYMHNGGPWTREFEGSVGLTPPRSSIEERDPWSAPWKGVSYVRLMFHARTIDDRGVKLVYQRNESIHGKVIYLLYRT